MAFEIPTSRRLPLSLLLSLVVHALLLSLTFGGQGRGLPGIGFPWQERRFEAPDLRVVLMPTKPIVAEPTTISPTSAKQPPPQTTIKPPVASAMPVKPLGSPAETPAPTRIATEAQTSFSINEPMAKAPIEQTVADEPTLKPSLASSKISAPMPAKPVQPEATALPTIIEPAAATEVVASVALTPIAAPALMAVERAELAAFAVPPQPSEPMAPIPVIAVAASASTGARVLPTTPADAAPLETVQREAARLAAAQVEAQRQQDARLAAAKREAQLEAKAEAQRQGDKLEAARAEAAAAATTENAKVETAKAETARQEAARVESTRLEAARLEAQRQEVARLAATQLAATQLDARRNEIARQDAARAEAARAAARAETTRLAAAQLEAQRQEIARQGVARADAARDAARDVARDAAGAAARLDSERQEGVRQDAARIEASRALAEKEEDAKRDARRQAMGRTLNEEAAQRKAAEAAETATRSTSTLPYSLSTARRARLWGRTDPNAELVLYADGWARKIESNTLLDTVREVAKRPHTDPMVTVAIRSDGSVESVTFVLSSGVAEVDEAIRQIVQSHVPYRAFPPGLARDVDVIEVRRTWHFDIGIRLY